MDHPFVPGLEVVVVYSSFDKIHSIKTTKITKLLKNDKFKVEGYDCQWRIVNKTSWHEKDKAPQWSGEEVSSNNFRITHFNTVYLKNDPKVSERIEKQKAATQQADLLSVAERLIEDFRRNSRNTVLTEAQKISLEAVVKAFDPTLKP